jgi:cysteine desulfurase
MTHQSYRSGSARPIHPLPISWISPILLLAMTESQPDKIQAPIYLDHHATTPVAPEVFEEMKPYFTEIFGNAISAQHSFGWAAKEAIEKARTQVAELMGAQAREIVFTSGTTESVHLAILGTLEIQIRSGNSKAHFITSAVEHKCVLGAFERLEELGATITIAPVNRYGQVSLDELKKLILPETVLVSLIHGNNEIGSLNPIAEIGAYLRSQRILFHIDAAQTFGREPINVVSDQIDLLSLSAHKLYGPKGVGALYMRQTSPRVRLAPLLRGGLQEKGLRAGTHNVPGIVGLGSASQLAQSYLISERARLTELRDQSIRKIQNLIPDVILNGHPQERLCNNISISISGIRPDQLLLGLTDIAVSSASACSAGASFSHVLKAIGQEENEDLATIRIGMGRSTRPAQMDHAIQRIGQVVAQARR